jgi:hypothetical protein
MRISTPTFDWEEHCSFVDNWIVYHCARESGSGWDRVVRAQTFTWDGPFPVFGEPQE